MKDHIVYYLLLFSILLFGVALFNFSQDANTKLLVLVATAISYALVGIFHHLKNHDLVAKIVVEYILIAALGATVAFFIFKGGFGF